ncbi:hypothetical protein R1sor_002253 [Riccia sorocarpa]|uniref:Uncharacterized protein n=1 Tax=Riccia sorocarpa TaxID=122646 RepID=A0ABD3GZY1_9MARC
MQQPDSTGKASKASARRNNTDISRAPSSPIRPPPLQKSLSRKPTPASQHPGDASAHATAFESIDSDQDSEDFSDRETMQRPDSTGKAFKASARRNNTDISRAPSSPIRPPPLQKSLGRKPTPASQHPSDASAHATAFEPEDSDQGSEDFYGTMQRLDSTGKASKASARRNNTDIYSRTYPMLLSTCNACAINYSTTCPQSDKNSLPDHLELMDVSKIALKDLPQMLSDESYSTIALVILGCKTKADLDNKIGKYATDLKTLSHRKAFNTKPLDEKIRMVVEDSIRRNLVSLQGRAARQEGKLILERTNVKFTAHLAF